MSRTFYPACMGAALLAASIGCSKGDSAQPDGSVNSSGDAKIVDLGVIADASSMMQPDLGVGLDAVVVQDAEPAETGPVDLGMMAPDAGMANLHGKRPQNPAALPEFMALSHDNKARSRADLLGRPTVMWFFPFAGTPG